MGKDLFDMDPWECESLLRAHVVGRIALSTPDGPLVFPVNYSVVDGAIVVRTTPYGPLARLGRDARIAFEIDQFDHERQRGWSVLARGHAEAISDPDDLAHIQQVWPPRPWASGSRTLHLRLRWDELTGRKLGTGWDPGQQAVTRRTV